MTSWYGTLALVALLLVQPAPTIDDAALWEHYAAWVAGLEVIKPGERKSMADMYVAQLVAEGVSKDEATKRLSDRATRGAQARREVVPATL